MFKREVGIVRLRSWCVEDFTVFAPILCETWMSFTLSSSYEVGLQKAKIYLRQCLEVSTKALVLEVEQEPAGVLFLRNNSDVEPNIAMDAVQGKPNGFIEQIHATNSRYKEIQESLRDGIDTVYDGEIVLLLIKPSAKGKGLGQFLFAEANKYFRNTKCRHFFLYTDSSCDYMFYHHMGMNQVRAKALYPNHRKKKFDFYLYDSVVSCRP